MSRTHDRALVEIARAQHGLITSADLLRVTGRADERLRRLRSGLWQEVLPGVLASATVEVTDGLVASAAMLWEPTALLSHHTAARLESIWVPDHERLRVTVPFRCTKRSVAQLEVVRTRVAPERFRTDGLHRWTLPARTVVDLGMVLTRGQLDAVLLSAVRARKVVPTDVEAIVATMPGRAGLADVRAMLRSWAPERESLLEDRLAKSVSWAFGGDPVRQHEVRDSDGRVLARIDVALVDLKLAFEADGLAFHSTDEQLARDQARDRMLVALGWLVIRFREDALRNPAAVRREIEAVITRRRGDLRAAYPSVQDHRAVRGRT